MTVNYPYKAQRGALFCIFFVFVPLVLRCTVSLLPVVFHANFNFNLKKHRTVFDVIPLDKTDVPRVCARVDSLSVLTSEGCDMFFFDMCVWRVLTPSSDSAQTCEQLN